MPLFKKAFIERKRFMLDDVSTSPRDTENIKIRKVGRLTQTWRKNDQMKNISLNNKLKMLKLCKRVVMEIVQF